MWARKVYSYPSTGLVSARILCVIVKSDDQTEELLPLSWVALNRGCPGDP